MDAFYRECVNWVEINPEKFRDPVHYGALSRYFGVSRRFSRPPNRRMHMQH
jgi:hypothetical protein